MVSYKLNPCSLELKVTLDESLTFYLVPQAGQSFYLFCELSQHLINAVAQHSAHSWSPDDEWLQQHHLEVDFE